MYKVHGTRYTTVHFYVKSHKNNIKKERRGFMSLLLTFYINFFQENSLSLLCGLMGYIPCLLLYYYYFFYAKEEFNKGKLLLLCYKFKGLELVTVFLEGKFMFQIASD